MIRKPGACPEDHAHFPHHQLNFSVARAMLQEIQTVESQKPNPAEES